MQALLHSLNIGTLATWLSVAGFGTVGVVVHERHADYIVSETAETLLPDADFILGDASLSALESDPVETLPPETNPASLAETLPTPPELPTLAETTPLPEIPELPAPAPTLTPTIAETNSAFPTQSAPRSTPSRTVRATPPKATRLGKTGGGTPGTDASRLAAGRMPPPSYPSEARRKGQTGTVVVEFTVDASGRVISAYAKSPSPWQLLNNEAVNTVRRWKFPAGSIMKLQRPIVFQLR